MRFGVLIFLAAWLPVSASLADGRERQLASWHRNASEKCLITVDSSAVSPDQTRLRTVLDIIDSIYPEGNPFLDLARDQKTAICIEDRSAPELGFFDAALNLIALHFSLNLDETVVILTHELRHLDQYSRGFCQSARFDVKEEVRFTYVIEADAMAVTAHEIWRMKELGYSGPWYALEHLGHYNDVAQSYAEIAGNDGTADAALTAAFDQWFTSEWRRDTYELATCMFYYDELDRTNTIQSYGLRSDSLLQNVCVLPDGSRYKCDLPAR
ncbi:DUF6782 family putative metallopeptidase [Pseudohalocynthiibacter aestuariivivens]|jgi:Putative metallopeptidase family (DUF6782)|uniref:DUF6782 family putative metallopeptidase n=1 Tax=Pseudohalocynthiibacter aestuariivivens TaxID=1591409 RepID=A0ABV5JI44_9RHOB|nr:DUF6782 family putative metallopeptidase [Pseudohalocynthiibacter aestuariivivens]MBS9717433.1 hypothetical protein [Pseudohalocynthiibacter aestuariivivens]MCK0102233.1 hypothetical protein [Pseudohalocynthiibacter sp. F2068]